MPKPKIDPNTGCWIWQGSISGGYGKIGYGGSGPKWAHRVYFEEAHGEIPEGQEVHHTCENRICVNPEHLEVLTAKAHGRKGSRAKLNPLQIQEIRRRDLSRRVRTIDLADEFGVTPQTIRDIKNGRTWQMDVTCPNCQHSFDPYD